MVRGLSSRHNEQLELFELASPCIGVCQTDERGYCCGCYRSRQERFEWQQMSNAQRQEVLRLCHDRARRKRKPVTESNAITASQLPLDGLDTPASSSDSQA